MYVSCEIVASFPSLRSPLFALHLLMGMSFTPVVPHTHRGMCPAGPEHLKPPDTVLGTGQSSVPNGANENPL